jgi:hypothetical protein
VKGWYRKMNLKSGAIQQFDGFSQFSSLKEFNHHMENWLLEYKHEFSKGERLGLKRLIRFCAKIPGVCNAKIGTLLKAIHEEYPEHGISRSTFKRMVLKAKEFGILTIHETERKNGSQSSNLYVFNRFSPNEPPKPEKLDHPKTVNLSKTINQNINKRQETDPALSCTPAKSQENTHTLDSASIKGLENPIELDDTFTNDRVPKDFVQLARNFFPEARTIEAYWRMTKIAAYRNNREKETGQVLSLSIQSFKQLINKLKSKKVDNPIAYYYGILNKKLNELYFEELFEMGF